MTKFKRQCVLVLTFVSTLLSFSQDLPPEIMATGDQGYCINEAIPIVESVSISDPDATDISLDVITIQISEGYESSADLLTLTGIHPSINAVWNPTAGQLTLNGPALFSEFETAINNVEFSTTQTTFTTDRSFSINLGNANYLPSTDHYYFYIDSFGIAWDTARDEAATRDYFGLQGYLATITTTEESQLAGEQAQGTGWIGASDAEAEGTWKWVTGPEAGTIFWQGAVSGTPVNGEFSFWNTGEPNNFGTIPENYAHITAPGIGIQGSWNDLPLGGDADVNSPYHPQGYIVEFGGTPGDPVINLSAATIIRMPQTSFSDAEGCEGDTFTLVVTTNTDEVIWYDGETSATVVNTGNTYTETFSTTTTLWISSKFMNCNVENRQPLTVNINPLPVANDITIQQCDDASADGISVFVLSNFSGAVNNGSTASTVSYFEDMALTIPIDANNYTNTSNNQVVFAYVFEPNTDCESIAQITLNVGLPTNESYNYDLCDDEDEDGFTEFNLSSLDAEVLTGFPMSAQTSYFATFNDALLNENQLSSNFTNTTTINQTIFVKITDGLECLGINAVNLTVKPLPQLLPDESVYYCTNTFPDKITLDSGVINDIPNNFFYNWSTGETTIMIEVNEPGIYTVEVMEVDGCSNLRTITVVPSSTAIIDNIDITDAVENNTISVDASGDGDYEFSIQSENGPFQDSNLFENVPSGIQTIYVSDKNGCGVVSESFPVIGFPKFFTPNGDGNNDLWTIDAFDEEFLANSRVQIFNRHGKLLTELSSENPFWDGSYNGNPLPNSDYWFTVVLQDGRTFAKHFALKR